MMRVRFILLVALAAVTTSAQQPTSCTTCHESDLFEPERRAKIQKFRDDVHSQVGLSCHDCHGGNPDPNADMGTAMDPNFASNRYVGAPKRAGIPAFCGRCHSSAEYMKRFNPAARVDQVVEYSTSVHGQRLAKGDEKVATCIDCHSVHGITRKSNPDSPVYATHVAETCSRCHSDPKWMSGYHTGDGAAFPTDQYARWRVSVHAKALLEKGDTAAPTCNDCHGNHGATPPGIESVSFVCGNCHSREAELFRKSAKHQGWTAHNELLAGGQTCGDCHDDDRVQLRVRRLSECITCHENHSVIRPSIAMIGTLPDTPCAFCHEGTGTLSALVAEPAAKAAHYQAMRRTLVDAADRMKLTGDARFDWLVDQTQHLPTHLQPSGSSRDPVRLRPEFARLFEKFRIGKTLYRFRANDGQELTVSVRRCGDCHKVPDGTGRTTATHFLAATRGLTSMIARSERILLAAHRGGVEVGKARAELDSAVDNQIELETMIHTFTSPADIQKKEAEGLSHARATLIAANASLRELIFRRQWLLVSLGVIILVLVALTLKIRTLG